MGRRPKRRALGVFLNGDRVGRLVRETAGALSFQYASDWLQRDDAVPVSLSLPLREDPWRGATVYAFFDNLLPDNDRFRRRLAEKTRADGTGPFELLAAIGRDCVGALQFLPDEIERVSPDEVDASPLSDKEIGERLRNLQTSPLGVRPDAGFRISLAGAQEKTALLRMNGAWHEPHGTTPTSHILKPAIGLLPNGIDLRQSPANEWLCLRFASWFGLDVATAELAEFDGLSCLVVERFDRRWNAEGTVLHRVPQEDLCQALGESPTRKYEAEGGPGISAILGFLDASDYRDHDRISFLRAQLVFYLLGAIDGHAKNFSIFLRPGGFCLTPLYDIMTVHPALAARQLEIKEARLAMAIGERRHYRLADIQRRHWTQTARAAGFPLIDFEELLQDIEARAATLPAFAKTLTEQVSPELVEPVVDGIHKGMRMLRATG